MIKVFQTVTDRYIGNCMQAALASLFELSLEEVPHFRILGPNWFESFWEFLKNTPYEYEGSIPNPRALGYWGEDRFEKIKDMTGVKGYFYAVVYSPAYFKPEEMCTFDAAKHAVIINKNLEIVHDPNPNNQNYLSDVELRNEYPLSKVLDHNGIIDIFMINEKSVVS